MTATAQVQVDFAAAVEAFNVTARPAVERAIADAVRDLATGLGPIDAALASALDAEGPAGGGRCSPSRARKPPACRDRRRSRRRWRWS
jgi:hypothetical protein